ncbi:hypothetical protein [Halostella pelagica]|uniref:hypothetical protein n=1 Tax=Halostella pelagica TaxID=2583824 RepID=UPI0010806807|nr:hypothetical protein [Halostella pelagica]
MPKDGTSDKTAGREQKEETEDEGTGSYPDDYFPPDLRNPMSSAGAEMAVDPRLPEEAITEKRTRTELPINQGVNLPIEKIGGVALTGSHLDRYGITLDEGRFMRAVVKAMNRELQGYNLTESMIGIKDQYDIDEEKLIDAGYLKRHTGVDRRAYYTILPTGQQACRAKKKQGREIGDIGADTPHRVGIDLARSYYGSLSEVCRVELAVRENGKVVDLLVIDKEGKRSAIIEVEGGRVNADPNISAHGSSGINNYDSVRADYRMLADSPGESIWVVRNYEIAGTLLRALSSGDNVPFTLPKYIIQSIENTNMRIKTMNKDHIAPLQDDGIHEIVTFRQLRNWLR